MSERVQFTESLKQAIKDKAGWFNSTALPKLLDDYRMFHTCVKNIYDVLMKRSLITPDPYKDEGKITKITAPSSENFPEGESNVIIGSRYSQYESMLDFITTHFKFTIENFSLPKIKRLTELNDSFKWGDMNTGSVHINTRALASLLNTSRKGLDPLSLSLLNDSLSKNSETIGKIDHALKELTSFKREEYKLKVRTDICQSEGFSFDAIKTQNDEIKQIKGEIAKKQIEKQKFPSYSELITEIANEDLAGNKDVIQAQVLKRLTVKVEKKQPKKEVINTKSMIIDSVRGLSAVAPIYSEIVEKLINNKEVLEGTKNTPMQKLKKFFRSLLNMKEPPIVYKFIIEDKDRGSKISREVDVNVFINNINKKSLLLNALGNVGSAEYQKIANATEEMILQFANKQISENKEILSLLTAADDYFKSNVNKSNRSRIKGLKIDLVTINNAIVKANKRRGEYLDTVEDLAKKKKLGIRS